MLTNIENLYNLKNYKLIRLNQTNNGIWFYPSIWTFSRMKWAPIIFKDLNQIFVQMKFDQCIILFDVNKKLIQTLFNFIQKRYGYHFFLKYDSIIKYKKDFIFQDKVNDKLTIIWNYKVIKNIFKGKILSMPFELLKNEFNFKHNKKIRIILNKNKFEIYNSSN